MNEIARRLLADLTAGMTALTAEEILTTAADIVERGWRQDAESTDHRRCAVIAMLDAAGVNVPAFEEAVDALAKELGVCVGGFGDPVDIGDWNDQPGRAVEEVATALRSAKRFLFHPDETGQGKA
jgi:hypothetical protein